MRKLFLPFLLFMFCGTLTTNAQVINVEDIILRLKDSVNFSGFINANFSISQASNRVLVFHNDAQVEKLLVKHFFLGIGSYNLISSDNNNFVNDNSLHLRYNYEFHHRFYGELFFQTQNSPFATITNRDLVGLGIRIKVQHGKIFRLYTGISFISEKNIFLGDSVYHYYNRISSYMSYNWLINSNLRLVQTIYYQPSFDNISNYRVSTKASFLAIINQHFSFNSSFILESLNIPIVEDRNLRKNNYVWSNGLRYDF